MFKKFLLLMLVGVVAGCGAISPFALIPIGVNTIMYWKEGEARKFYSGEAADVYSKLHNSVKDYGHVISDETGEGTVKNFISTSQNHKFKWHVEQYDPKVVLVKCRIDFWGDREYTELIYKKLDEKMGVKTTKVVDESTSRKWKRKATKRSVLLD